ncbi:MAG: DUF456 domain-containing protein [Armatimonadota bacterium]|nr:DUF456 domain-containing protein [Armatimonadota bacterium]
MNEALVQIVCVIGVLAAFALIVIGLPGTILIVIEATIYGYATGFKDFSPYFLLLLLVLSAFAEIADNVIGAVWAKRAGSSWQGIIGSVIGAIVGAMAGSAIVPVIGTIIGGLIGSFAGAYVFEYHRLRDGGRAVKAGWGAFAGRMFGILLKLLIAVTMAVLFLMRLF